ncbi:TraR/DksA family transcriptional regulator [Blastopirellula retiformator]|uniref:RNA polymerase-binding transcription factor DksA n=1 Tax=Blastopirellula retiformator TaxID=2527970 RepID=A0A5C5V176_9BACT|nr:TraR/DksA family transcriptional regulator [Blastopirellula retiformator]TWT31723.1 RNA polymerase-binding transcription factor DksA [Blastopirellula retiformator]
MATTPSDPKKHALKPADAEPFRVVLQKLRARLRGDVSHMTDSALRKTRSESSGDLSSMPIHMADIGSDNYEQEFTLSMLAAEEGTLQLIQEALARIESGVYGACLECGGRIKKPRLHAIPYTPLCIDCANQRERH